MDKHDEDVTNPSPEKLINDVGALAEISALFYTTLIDHGHLDIGTAGFLTEIFMKIMLGKD